MPKCASAMDVPTPNAATPDARVLAQYSPKMPRHAIDVCQTASPGIQTSQARRNLGARCRSAMTQAKLNWNPAFDATPGSLTTIHPATTARTASPCQSRRSMDPIDPTMAINAERSALGAGAMTKSATAAPDMTHAATNRVSRKIIRAKSPTIQPRTARLKPEIASMCARPVARNAFSISA